ncbi:MAG TPA: hypothetical protein VMI75_24180 [Polyangiaceae bacterium]|nr:hypothetical protein [Polyangiaceae bacterium]
MKSKLMLMGAASALLVSFACGCAAEMGTDEGTSTDPKAQSVDEKGQSADPKTQPADEKTGTTESPLIWGNPAGWNPPGFNPLAPGLNPPGWNPAGMGWGVAPGVGLGWGVPGVGLGFPGFGMGNINGGWNMPGVF